MIHPDRCPECGAERSADICLRCLIRLGIDGAGGGRWSGGTSAAGVLETIAASIGPVPRVLLRDTIPGEQPGPILRKPAADEDDASIRYRIDGEIARGGMGAILKGRDPDLGRDVALKVLRDDYRDDADMVRRFVEEAQIGGQLQHPGIVPIYELGTLADRRPFFAMKLVKGHTLAELLEARKHPDDDRPRLLSIFEAIAQTMAYAHARGVIHRDMKPSNVMVGSFGEVQVMDWGLAKVLPRGGIADDQKAGQSDRQETVIATSRSGSDGPGLSWPGSALGTPSYMAPEQARGESDRVDERADVFAMGSILCEALTGEPAFLGRSSGEIMRKAARGDMADALIRLDGCGADPELTAIAKNCLASEAEDRPRHAGAVAERITAYLAGVQDRLRAAELARAAEAARAEEARRTAEAAEGRARSERRARRLTVALAAALLALAGLGGAGGWLFARQRANGLAATTRAVDDALGQAADLRGRALVAPVGELGGWTEALAEAHRAEDAVNQGVADDALRRRVSTAIDELERLRAEAERRARDTEAERRLVARLAEIRIAAGINENDMKKTAAEYAAAFCEFGVDLEKLDPREAGAALANRSVTAEIIGALDTTLVAYHHEQIPRRWIEIAQFADPDPWRNHLRGLVDRPAAERKEALKRLAADRAALRGQTASGLLLLSRMLGSDGEPGLAAEVAHTAWLRSPGDFWVNWMIGMSSWRLGKSLTRPDEAARYLTAAIALRPDNTRTHFNLGQALRLQGKVDEAIAEFREVKRIDPRADNADQYAFLLLQGQGKLDEAIAELREAVRLHRDDASSHQSLGFALKRQGRTDEAIAEYRECIRLQPKAAPHRVYLGLLLGSQGKLDEAIAEFREAIRLKPDSPVVYSKLGEALLQQEKLDEALAAVRRAGELSPSGELISVSVTRLEHQIHLARRLPAVLDGKDKPVSPAERLDFAELCDQTRRFAAAARLSVEAFAADPTLAQRPEASFADPTPAQRPEASDSYNAAAAAAMAGAGHGRREPPLDDREKARWRKQAVAWLQARLARLAEPARARTPKVRAELSQELEHWRHDPDLAGIREADSIASLPADEQAACRALWAEVDALLARVRN